MGLRLIAADLDRDRKELVDLLNRNLPHLSHQERFSWLYKKNPDGLGYSWMLIDSKKDQPVGMASVFPRTFCFPGGIFRAGQVGDFAIDDEYRSLGPAIQLQKATLTPVTNGLLDFCYDTPPGAKGMAPFVRMGLKPFGQMMRYAKPLRLDVKINAIIGSNLIGHTLAKIGNRIFWAFDQSKKTRHLNVELSAGRFGEEFFALNERMQKNGKIFCARTPTFLNWRYRDNPCHSYEVFTIRDGDKLRGYCVYLIDGGSAYLMDLFGENEVLPELLYEVIDHLRKTPVSSFQANFLEGSDALPILMALGFRYRSPGCFFVGEVAASSSPSFLLESKNWILAYADSAL